MESNLKNVFTVHQDLDRQLTLKTNIKNFLNFEAGGVDSMSPELVSLPRLKLEIDTMATIIQEDIKHEVFGQDAENFIVQQINKINPRKVDHLDAISNIIIPTMYGFAAYAIKEMSNDPKKEKNISRANVYRQAYFEKSPASAGEEIDYVSLEKLIGNGFITLAQITPEIIKSLETKCHEKAISPDKSLEIIKQSGHLLVLLARLSMADFMRFMTVMRSTNQMLSDYIVIHKRDSEFIAHYNKDMFYHMRQFDDTDRSNLNHRVRTGCPSTVDLDGSGSLISLGYTFFVNVAERTGFFKQ